MRFSVLIVVLLVGVTLLEAAPVPQNKRAKWRPKAIRDKEAAEAKVADEAAAKASEEAAKVATTTEQAKKAEEVKVVEPITNVEVQVDEVITKAVTENKAAVLDASTKVHDAKSEAEPEKTAVTADEKAEEITTVVDVATEATVAAEEPAATVVADESAAIVVADEPVAVAETSAVVADESVITVGKEPAVVIAEKPVTIVVDEPAVVKVEESSVAQ